MTTTDNDNPFPLPPRGSDPHDARDLLLNRLVEGRASGQDWETFTRLSAAEPALALDLLATLRDQHELERYTKKTARSVEHVALPGADATGRDISPEALLARSPTPQGSLAKITPRSGWAGWAVAAVVALAAGLDVFGLRSAAPEGGVRTAGLLPSLAQSEPKSSEEYLGAYLDAGAREGRVIGEAPRYVLVNAAPAADGDGYEVVYLRQIAERARVPALYRASRDEFGRSVAVPVTPALLTTPAPRGRASGL